MKPWPFSQAPSIQISLFEIAVKELHVAVLSHQFFRIGQMLAELLAVDDVHLQGLGTGVFLEKIVKRTVGAYAPYQRRPQGMGAVVLDAVYDARKQFDGHTPVRETKHGHGVHHSLPPCAWRLGCGHRGGTAAHGDMTAERTVDFVHETLEQGAMRRGILEMEVPDVEMDHLMDHDILPVPFIQLQHTAEAERMHQPSPLADALVLPEERGGMGQFERGHREFALEYGAVEAVECAFGKVQIDIHEV